MNIIHIIKISIFATFQQPYPTLVFSEQLFEIFNNIFFKEQCYKKRIIVIRNVDQMSITNVITQLFI